MKYKQQNVNFSVFATKIEMNENLIKYSNHDKTEKINMLETASELPVALLLNSLSDTPGCIELSMCLRKNSLELLSKYDKIKKNEMVFENLRIKEYLTELNGKLKIFLSVAFSVDMLSVQRVSFETSSGIILEKIAKGEAVHNVRTLNELKKRLRDGRRCYSLFHTCLPQVPLAFVHVAFTDTISKSITEVNSVYELVSPKCAIFYSVNSLHSSLGGLNMATRLIKSVINELKTSHPSISTLSTLSPIPDFKDWLKQFLEEDTPLPYEWPEEHYKTIKEIYSKTHDTDNEYNDIVEGEMQKDRNSDFEEINLDNAEGDEGVSLDGIMLYCEVEEIQKEHIEKWFLSYLFNENMNSNFYVEIKELLEWLCCQYIMHEKSKHNLPYDPVARFHLRNGASFHRINWMANPSNHGMESSFGLMVNYLYDTDLKTLQHRAEKFDNSGTIHTGECINNIMRI